MTDDPYAPLTGNPSPMPDIEGDGSVCVFPVPNDAPTPTMRHSEHKTPAKYWTYEDATGGILGYACRFQVSPTEKTIRIYTLWRKPNGVLKWQWKHWPKPKPLYGLKRLAERPDAPVVLCEGEKAADAAALLLPDYVAMCWPGGANGTRGAHFGPLAHRDVLLWRDNDKPGFEAMQSVAGFLYAAQANRVRMLNLEALERHIGKSLEPGDDASDIEPDKFVGFLEQPESIINAPTPEEQNGAAHQRLVQACKGWLASEGFTVNAVGRWLKDGKEARRTNVVTLAQEFAFGYRYQSQASTERVIEIMTVSARRWQSEQFVAIQSRILDHPVTDAAKAELARFVGTITGDQDELIYAVFAHFLWNCKRSLAEMPREFDLMPILFNSAQGGGKSTAVARLCSPLGELVEAINATLLTDDRRAPELENYLVGIWDEMEGAGRADVEALKNTITCTSKSYRPMKTNDAATAIRRMNFIGTSNKPVAQMIRDTSGARRFVEVEALPKLDWDAINGIDYGLIWSAVSEREPTPILPYRELLARHQEGLRHRDAINLWLYAEDWKGGRWIRKDGFEQNIPEYSSEDGDTAENIRARYHHWCRLNGENVIGGQMFYHRLAEEGFTVRRELRLNQQRRYHRPLPPS